MVKLNKIYTKTGDKGTTGLGTGERVSKADLRIASYGTVDETNAILGIVRLYTNGEHDDMLARIQNDLFDLGADLCTPETADPLDFEPLRIIDAQVRRLEVEIDYMNANLNPLTSFILPGGTKAAAHLHHARTAARRAERLIVELDADNNEHVNPIALQYMNRLSDHLFVLGRVVNEDGQKDVLWVPGDNR